MGRQSRKTTENLGPSLRKTMPVSDAKMRYDTTMSNYKAEVTENSAKAIQQYEDTGKQIEVKVSTGFVYVRVDGEEIAKAHVSDIEGFEQ